MSREVDLLGEVYDSEIPNLDSRIVGWLSVRSPELLRAALDDVKRHYAEKENGS